MKVIIRKIIASDKVELIDLFNSCFDKNILYHDLDLTDNSHIIVAEIDNKVVGILEINYIYNTDLIEFAKFINQTNMVHDSIRVQINNFYGHTYCSLDFIKFGCSIRADDTKHIIQYTKYTASKDIKKELVSLNTKVSPYKEIYNDMIDFIIKYLMEG